MELLRAYYEGMGQDDFQLLAVGFFTTIVVGTSLLALVGFGLAFCMRRIRPKPKPAPQKPKTPLPPAPSAAAAAAAPSVKRHIPQGAQSALMARGKRQMADKDYEKALVTYLSLLYASVESKDENALPTSLTDCLRGAAACYRELGQPQNAVRFLQAERRIFEEVVASASSGGGGGVGGAKKASILESLLTASPDGDAPRRCKTLSEVAVACTKGGRHDVALAYRVKAAAMRHRITGKPLDEKSPEFIALAEALSKVQGSSDGKQMVDRAVHEATTGDHAVPQESPLIQMIKDRTAHLDGDAAPTAAPSAAPTAAPSAASSDPAKP